MTNAIAMAVVVANNINLRPIPENRGNSAIPWATPMVKGFIKAPAKPAPAPMNTMAAPVKESNPRAIHKLTIMGIKGSVSSAMPMTAPPKAKAIMITGISRVSFPENFFQLA